MRKSVTRFGLLSLVIAMVSIPLHATAPSGAIFTTLVDGTAVNFNIYDAKEDVYLDGGPGPGAPQGAAGLDDGTYVFQVTSPSGKVLLSTDPAKCRQFTVSGGIITGVVAATNNGSPCQHQTGLDVDHNATTVQLFPFNDTPNPGGVYKVWATMVGDYTCDLNVVDCGATRSNKHGFLPANSKTDNFKVKGANREIDVRFWGPNGLIDGLKITWIDTLSVSNPRYSYYQSTPFVIPHLAHVENVEDGTHEIVIQNQLGCTVSYIGINPYGTNKKTTFYNGPQTLEIQISQNFTSGTVLIEVYCQ